MKLCASQLDFAGFIISKVYVDISECLCIWEEPLAFFPLPMVNERVLSLVEKMLPLLYYYILLIELLSLFYLSNSSSLYIHLLIWFIILGIILHLLITLI